MSCSAADSGVSRRVGTGMAVLPRATITSISLPSGTTSPSGGSCDRIVSGSTSMFSSVPARTSVSPSSAACASASTNSMSANEGTITSATDADGLADADGESPPPVSMRKTTKPTTTRIASPSSAAIQAHGPLSSSSGSPSSVFGGGGGAPFVETGAGGAARA